MGRLTRNKTNNRLALLESCSNTLLQSSLKEGHHKQADEMDRRSKGRTQYLLSPVSSVATSGQRVAVDNKRLEFDDLP